MEKTGRARQRGCCLALVFNKKNIINRYKEGEAVPGAAASPGMTGTNKGMFLDESLFPLIAAGDGDAFLRLYEQTRTSVYSFALSMLHNKHEAEDVMQDTYLKIRMSAHLYQPRGKPMAWVITIVRNLCLMRLRQGASDVWELMETDTVEELSFDNVRSAEERMVLKTAFHVLSETELRIVILHAVSGLKHREIGDLLKIPLSTVLSRYSRAIGKLRKELRAV